MDRHAVFVDAGYLYAAGGGICYGVTKRPLLELSPKSFVAHLTAATYAACGCQLLRVYWYDGARDATPTAEHVEIANLPGVKLRLGRVVGGGQKGVDSRIVRDLIILATERAITTAYLLGGDEDLREGVTEAQERGVRVVLVRIEKSSVSRTMLMDADDVLTLSGTDVGAHLSLRTAAEVPEAAATELSHDGAQDDPAGMGRRFGVDWVTNVTTEARLDMIRKKPRIPYELDGQLLTAARSMRGGESLDETTRNAVRDGFWEAVESVDEEEKAKGAPERDPM